MPPRARSAHRRDAVSSRAEERPSAVEQASAPRRHCRPRSRRARAGGRPSRRTRRSRSARGSRARGARRFRQERGSWRIECSRDCDQKTRAVATGSPASSANRITRPARASALLKSPASIRAFASSTENRSSSTGAPASRASSHRLLEEGDRRFAGARHRVARDRASRRARHRPAPCVRALEATARAGRSPPRSARSETRSDRARRARPAGPDRPARGARGKAALPRRSRRGAGRPRRRSAPTARTAAASTPVASHWPDTSSRSASWLTICSEGTRAPASRREM